MSKRTNYLNTMLMRATAEHDKLGRRIASLKRSLAQEQAQQLTPGGEPNGKTQTLEKC